MGDDVVDLEEPGTRGAHRRDRFVRRVFGQPERALIAASDDPDVLLWTLFAAKEAAYKAAVKVHPGLPFAHRRFAVAPDLRSVHCGEFFLAVRTSSGPGWVHAVASTTVQPTLVAVDGRAPGEEPSIAARRLLRAAFALLCPGEPGELAVARATLPGSWDGHGPPRLLRDGEPLDVDVSLSHDGRFVSAAASLPRP